MSDVAPGWKLRVLLIQALFADPEILLLDEPTNNLDIATIRWLENVINERNSTMVIISHDRHFLNQVCTHMADLDYGKITVYPGNYDDFMEASTQARERQQSANAKAKERIAELQNFVRRFSANASKAKQATSRLKLIDKLKPEDVKPSSRQYPWIRFEFDEKEKLHRQAVEIQNLSFAYHGQRAEDLQQARPVAQRRRPPGDHRRKRRRQDDPAEAADGRVAAAARQHQVGGEGTPRLLRAGPRPGFQQRCQPDRLDRRLRARQRERRRRPVDADPRHPRTPAVLGQRSAEGGQGDLRVASRGG
jgi:hypothetical protein